MLERGEKTCRLVWVWNGEIGITNTKVSGESTVGERFPSSVVVRVFDIVLLLFIMLSLELLIAFFGRPFVFVCWLRSFASHSAGCFLAMLGFVSFGLFLEKKKKEAIFFVRKDRREKRSSESEDALDNRR